MDGVLWDSQQDFVCLLLAIVTWVLMAFRLPYLVSDLFCFVEKAIRQEVKRLPGVWGQEVSSAFRADLHSSVKSQVGLGWGHEQVILRCSGVGMEPGTLCMLGKPCAPESHPQVSFTFFCC